MAGARLRDRPVSGFPSGAVTFLFTDIEGSTRPVKALRERYPQVLAEHRQLVRAAIAGQAGRERRTGSLEPEYEGAHETRMHPVAAQVRLRRLPGR
jgi:class 3 adenylate cyclase